MHWPELRNTTEFQLVARAIRYHTSLYVEQLGLRVEDLPETMAEIDSNGEPCCGTGRAIT